MAQEIREIHLPLHPSEAFILLRDAGNMIPRFSNRETSPESLYLRWVRGDDVTQPLTVEAMVSRRPDGTSLIRLHALFVTPDPFGILERALDLFERTLKNRYQAHLDSVKASLPPKIHTLKRYGLTVSVAVCGALLLLLISFLTTTMLY